MAIVVNCPSCSRKLRVPDEMLGKKVKCPQCATTFLASEGGEPEPTPREDRPVPRGSSVRERPAPVGRQQEEEPEEKERPRRRREDDYEEDDEPVYRRPRRGGDMAANWRQILRGITMILISVLITVASYVVFILAIFLLVGVTFASLIPTVGPPGPGGRPGPPQPNAAGAAAGLTGLVVVVVLFLLVMFGAWALKMLGHIFCLPSPARYAAKILAIVTLCLVGGSAALWLLSILISLLEGGLAAASLVMMRGGSGVGGIVSLLSGLAGLAGWIVFLFYLRSIALAVSAKQLASSIVAYLIALGVAVVLGILSICALPFLGISIAASASNRNNPGAEGIAALGAIFVVCAGFWLLVTLAMLVWYIVILVQARSAVQSYMVRSDRERLRYAEE